MSVFLFERMLARSTPLLHQFSKHPFHIELCIKRTLPRSTFETFAEQDAHYLASFAKVLCRISERFTDRRHAQQFKRLSEEIIQAEMNLYSRYLKKPHAFSFFSLNSSPPVREFPIIQQYTQYLLTTANTGSIEEAVASCVACFWIYNKELGKHTRSTNHQNNYYAPWIASYSSKKFTHATEGIVQTMQEMAQQVRCPLLEKKIIEAFHRSVKYEWQFYNEVMNCEKNSNQTSPCLHIPFQK